MLTVTTRTMSINGEYYRIESMRAEGNGNPGKTLGSSGFETDNLYSTRLKKEKAGLLGLTRIKVNNPSTTSPWTPH
jgi:hypothetical protein